jgi:hypothetical protein
MSKHEDSIREGAKDLLGPGEQIIAAMVVSPRGASTAAGPGVVVSEIGRQWSGKNKGKAGDAGLVVKKSSGLALTGDRLITFDLGISLMGAVKEVKGVLSEVPLAQIDEITSKWNVLNVTAGGTQFKLEGKPPSAKAFAEAFAETKAA